MGIRKMSIQEGLNTLKVLESRINKALSDRNIYGAVVVGDRTVNGFQNNNDFVNKVKENFQSIQDLIKRRTLIKNAIIKKNAEVEVEINGKKMTLAEAINMKTYIQADRDLLNQLITQYNYLKLEYERAESRYLEKLDAHLESIVGKDQKNKMDENKQIIEFFSKKNEPKFIDPLNLPNVIDEMSKEISEFESTVDFVITRANITNDIEFEDPTYENNNIDQDKAPDAYQ